MVSCPIGIQARNRLLLPQLRTIKNKQASTYKNKIKTQNGLYYLQTPLKMAIDLVPRVLGLFKFGQLFIAWRDSGEIEN